jgi:hypothetical protein
VYRSLHSNGSKCYSIDILLSQTFISYQFLLPVTSEGTYCPPIIETGRLLDSVDFHLETICLGHVELQHTSGSDGGLPKIMTVFSACTVHKGGIGNCSAFSSLLARCCMAGKSFHAFCCT